MAVLDERVAGLRSGCAGFADKRKTAGGVYWIADCGLSAFALFFMQPSPRSISAMGATPQGEINSKIGVTVA